MVVSGSAIVGSGQPNSRNGLRDGKFSLVFSLIFHDF